MKKKVYRHWDLLIVPVESTRENTVEVRESGCILEWGVTNHHHRADSNATVCIATEEPRENNWYYRGYVLVPEKKTTKITHEAHWTIELNHWNYETYVQRVSGPIENRKVLD